MQHVGLIEEAIELLPRISRLAFTALANDREMGSLTLTQARAVALLYHDGRMTVSEIADGLACSLASASELLDRLEAKGLVVRSQDPEDRRRTWVELSDRALEVGRRIHDLRRAQVHAALAQLDVEQWPVFIASLRALASALETPPGVIAAGSSRGSDRA